MANYELMVIVNPDLGDDERTSSIDNLKNIVTENEGTISKEDVWGEKKLAYQINRKDKGFYVLIELDLDGTKLVEVTRKINLDKNIYRHMFVRKDS